MDDIDERMAVRLWDVITPEERGLIIAAAPADWCPPSQVIEDIPKYSPVFEGLEEISQIMRKPSDQRRRD